MKKGDLLRVKKAIQLFDEALESGQAITTEEACARANCSDLLDLLKASLAKRGSVEKSLNPEEENEKTPPIPLFQEPYRGLSHLAAGGLGDVYLAEDKKFHRVVAIKVMKKLVALDEKETKRFLREAEITSKLNTTGVVPIHDFGQCQDGRPYYVMSYIRGKTLHEAIDDFHQNNIENNKQPGQKVIEFQRLLRNLLRICSIVSVAHQQGIIHRDLKPANILLSTDGEVRVLDWGLATPVPVNNSNKQTGKSLAKAESSHLSSPSSLPLSLPSGSFPEQVSTFGLSTLSLKINARSKGAVSILSESDSDSSNQVENKTKEATRETKKQDKDDSRNLSGQDYSVQESLGSEESHSNKGDYFSHLPIKTEVERSQIGYWKGSPAYMSPEQAQARGELTELSDQFSLGAILYKILTGTIPYRGSTDHAIVEEVKQGNIVPPEQQTRNHPAFKTPSALVAICLKAMSLSPSQRYPTVADFAHDLECWLADEPVEVYREPFAVRSRRWVKRHRTLVASALGMSGIALASGVILALQMRNSYIELSKINQDLENSQLKITQANKDLENSYQQLKSSYRLEQKNFEEVDRSLLEIAAKIMSRGWGDAKTTAPIRAAVLTEVADHYTRYIEDNINKSETRIELALAYFRRGSLKLFLAQIPESVFTDFKKAKSLLQSLATATDPEKIEKNTLNTEAPKSDRSGGGVQLGQMPLSADEFNYAVAIVDQALGEAYYKAGRDSEALPYLQLAYDRLEPFLKKGGSFPVNRFNFGFKSAEKSVISLANLVKMMILIERNIDLGNRFVKAKTSISKQHRELLCRQAVEIDRHFEKEEKEITAEAKPIYRFFQADFKLILAELENSLQLIPAARKHLQEAKEIFSIQNPNGQLDFERKFSLARCLHRQFELLNQQERLLPSAQVYLHKANEQLTEILAKSWDVDPFSMEASACIEQAEILYSMILTEGNSSTPEKLKNWAFEYNTYLNRFAQFSDRDIGDRYRAICLRISEAELLLEQFPQSKISSYLESAHLACSDARLECNRLIQLIPGESRYQELLFEIDCLDMNTLLTANKSIENQLQITSSLADKIVKQTQNLEEKLTFQVNLLRLEAIYLAGQKKNYKLALAKIRNALNNCQIYLKDHSRPDWMTETTNELSRLEALVLVQRGLDSLDQPMLSFLSRELLKDQANKDLQQAKSILQSIKNLPVAARQGAMQGIDLLEKKIAGNLSESESFMDTIRKNLLPKK